MQLSEFRELGTGHETPILPSTEDEVRTDHVRFPVSSPGLTPLDAPALSLRLPRFSAFQFRRVRLQGFRLYSLDGSFFNDLSLVAPRKANTQFARKLDTGFTEGLTLDADRNPVPASDPEVVRCDGCAVLCSDEPSNFGAWLSRMLPKLLLLRRVREVNRVMLYAAAPWMPGFLQTFVPSVEIVRHDPGRDYVLEQPVIPSLAALDNYFRREVREELQPFIDRAQAAFPETPDRIFISRRKLAITRPSHRVLENETELVESLLPHGYREFFPEEKSLAEQMATISRARSIISLGGSNLFGCYFARNAEMIVDLEAAKTFVYGHANLLASTRLPYSIVVGVRTKRGPRDAHRNWRIDVDCLMDGLAELEML